MKKALIVFIDSLPYESVSQTNFLSSFGNLKGVIPGFGYSVNIKAELFGGYKPDDAGFLNNWTYKADSRFRPYRRLFQFLYIINFSFDKILHKVLSKILGCNLLRIPFSYLSYFDTWGIEAYYDAFPKETIFTRYPFTKVLYSSLPPGDNRDELLFDKALEIIQENQYQDLFVASADLDHITHSAGVGSERHQTKIMELDSLLGKIIGFFLDKNPQGKVVILSDHGMANVQNGIQVNLERHFGKASEKSYIYFVDSVTLRVWCFDKSLREEISSYLRNLKIGSLLSEDQRRYYGITSPAFGNIILVLDIGSIFQPSFFGKNQNVRAMHGYLPEDASQKGIFISSLPQDDKECLTATEVYDYLIKFVQFDKED
jgi:predicted AlkP superfamily pyrophosphatase or phosphodiesterase